MKRVKAQLSSRVKKKLAPEKVAPVVGLLLKADGELAPKVRRAVLDLGPAAVPFLIELVTEADALAEEVGHSRFVQHAVELLGELRAGAALPALLELLDHTDDADQALQLALSTSLSAMGPALVEPALQRLAATKDDTVHDVLVDALTSSGVRDERVADLLARELDATEAGTGMDPMFFVKVTTLAAALVDQGRELSEAQKAKVTQATSGGSKEELLAQMARMLAGAGGTEAP